MAVMRKVIQIGHRSNAWHRVGKLPAARLSILTYHGVSARHDDLGALAGLHAAASVFEEQMAYLRKRHPVLPLEDALERLASGRPLPRGAVSITFDDGYRNNFEVAFPVLRRHGLPATIFLATSFVGRDRMIWHDRVGHALRCATVPEVKLGPHAWPLGSRAAALRAFSGITAALKTVSETEMQAGLISLEEQCGVPESPAPTLHDSEIMDWDEVRAMRDSGLVTFGSHTATHPILSRLTPSRVREELERSREKIESELASPCRLLAYPNGQPEDVTDEVVRCAAASGYSHAMTTVVGRARPGGDAYRVPRLGTGVSTPTLADFAFQTSGVRAWLIGQRSRLRPSSPVQGA